MPATGSIDLESGIRLHRDMFRSVLTCRIVHLQCHGDGFPQGLGFTDIVAHHIRWFARIEERRDERVLRDVLDNTCVAIRLRA